MWWPQFTDEERRRLVFEARMWLGSPYRLKSMEKRVLPIERSGVDCSLLMVAIHREALVTHHDGIECGFPIPADVDVLYLKYPVLPVEQLGPGNMVFFHSLPREKRWGKRLATHVGMLAGNGTIIHASPPSKKGKVVQETLDEILDQGWHLIDYKCMHEIQRWLGFSLALADRFYAEPPNGKSVEVRRRRSNLGHAAKIA